VGFAAHADDSGQQFAETQDAQRLVPYSRPQVVPASTSGGMPVADGGAGAVRDGSSRNETIWRQANNEALGRAIAASPIVAVLRLKG
jgi:hypothetical protein